MFNIDIDTGGTMTDGLVRGDGQVLSLKVETTPHDVTIAFVDIVEAVRAQLDLPDLQSFLSEFEVIWWLSTITSNVLAQRVGPNAVLAVDRDEAGLVPYHGDDAVTTYVADGTHEDEVAAYAARAKELWGSVDAFANNAGVEGQVAPVTDPAVEDFDKVPAVNVRRFFSGLKHVLPFMEEGASVVNTASPLGLVGGAGLGP
jgi:N-methylhydantoinase A/oxoprolinase/acetone carboxylase beta subunit